MSIDHDLKLFQSQYQQVLTNASKKLIPVHATFELTYRCNLICGHCYLQSEHPKKANELTFEEYKDFMDLLVDMQCMFLTFTGGEILIREDFFQIAEYARKRHFALRLFTNGTLIDQDSARRIAELRPVMVEISCYGSNEETYEKVTRVPGSWVKLRRAIDYLKKEEVPFQLKSVIMKQNLDNLEELVKFFISLDVPFRLDAQVTPLNNGNEEAIKNWRMNDEELFRAYTFLHSRISPFKNPEEERLLKIKLADKTTPCGAGRFTFRINPEGFISPCLQIPDYAGNIRKDDFRKLWKEAEIFNKFRQIYVSHFEECMKCEYLPFCKRCIGLNKLMNDDYLEIYREFCRAAKIKAKAIEEINKNNSVNIIFDEYKKIGEDGV
ncbi:MAG: radical SAM protein [Candidatus Coatesbacteria bacterium]|nr:radical SAM protein [Candidatus Coatesbacteria bacterium]